MRLRWATRSLLVTSLLVALPQAYAGPGTLFSADFTGAVQYPHVGNSFDGMDSNGADAIVSGELSFDSSLIPPAGTNFYSVPIPNANPIFTISLGSAPLTLTYAQGQVLGIDSQFKNIQGMVQYNNGSFWGVVYAGNFNFNGTPYQLDMQGSTWTIFQLSGPGPNGYPIGSGVASGYLNGNLTNITSIQPITMPVTGAVPEPSSYAMMLAGLAMIASLVRRRAQPRQTRFTPVSV